MPNQKHIALLPGLDGTGKMFFPIIPYLEDHFEITVVSYSEQKTLDELARHVKQQLPGNVPISLVAESFSGPVALKLMLDGDMDIAASVLTATFCKSPRPLLTGLVKYCPEQLFGMSSIWRPLLYRFAMEKAIDPRIKQCSLDLLDSVSAGVYQQRLELVDKTNLCSRLHQIDTKLLYIRASKDYLVPGQAGDALINAIENIKVADVAGPHMILQTHPEKCAALIINHITQNL